jgi:hypothetical protein
MHPIRLRVPRCALVALCLLAPVGPAFAQAGSRLALSVAVGPSPYDLSGTGTGFAAAAELSWRPVVGLVVEPGLTYFTYQSQFAERVHYLMNELSVQGELPLGSVRPFLGGGVGFARVVSGPEQTVATLHAVGGIRVDLSQAWGARAEMRARAVRPWTGNTVDFLFGLSRALQ